MTRTISPENHAHPCRHRFITCAAGLLLAIALSGCTSPGSRNDLMTKRREGESEKKKTWSGVSLADLTDVVHDPTSSALLGGFDEERVWSGDDDWEPAVAADPSSAHVYQLTTRFGALPSAIIFRRSSDGGGIWDLDQPLIQSVNWQADPQIQVADDGTVYAAYLDFDWSTVVLKSFDHGDTWTAPVDATEVMPWSDHPWLAISSDGRDVYLAVNASDSYVIASHDFGVTFGLPVQTNQDNRYWFHTGGAVAPNGDVYFAAADYAQTYEGENHVSVLRSADGGLTWDTTLLDTSSEAPPCGWAPGCQFGFFGPGTGLGIDTEGSVAVAYNAGTSPNVPNQIWVTISDDGVNWSTPESISHDSLDANNAFPAVVGGPAPGDFRVIWQGDANGNTSGWNTWYRRTTDGGENWGPLVRLSDLSDGAPYKNNDGYQFPYGDYLGFAVDGEGTNHAIWGEGTSYNGPGGTWYTRGLGLCEGDANGDGNVDPLDSGYVLARFGCPVGTGDPDCDSADQNGDGAVDPLDSGFVLARFGECP